MKKLAAAAILVLAALPSQANTLTWTGGGSTANWSQAANWSPAATPGSSDTLIFNPTSKNTSNNDLSGLAGLSLEFRGAADYIVQGNQFEAMSISIDSDQGSASLDPDVTIDSGVGIGGNFATSASRAILRFTHNVILSSSSTIFASSVSPQTQVQFLGNVSGPARLLVEGGSWFFSGNNTFSGSLEALDAGSIHTIIVATSPFALGTDPVSLVNGAELQISNPSSSEMVVSTPVIGPPPLKVQGSGPVRMTGALQVGAVTADVDLALDGIISHLDSIESGAGTVTLNNPANSFNNIIFRNTLQVNGTLRLGAAGVVPAFETILVSGTLVVDHDNPLENFNCSGTIDFALGASLSSGSASPCHLAVHIPPGTAIGPGSAYTLVRNGRGTFVGLPEGSTSTIGGQSFRITYVAGSGTDIALVAAGSGVVPLITSLSGVHTAAPEGQYFPLSVLLRNGSGAPITGTTVHFAADPGCAQWPDGASSLDAVTDSQGTASSSTLLMLHRAGYCSVTAQALDSTTLALDPFVFDATTANLTATPGSIVGTPGVPVNITFRATDASGTPLAGLLFTMYVAGSSAPLSNYQGTTNTDGTIATQLFPAQSFSPTTYTVHGGAFGREVVIPVAQYLQVQNMWWGGPSENGWGMSLIEHNDVLFAALYIYDASGNPTWVVMPGGSWDSTSMIYTGSLYRPTGSPFYAYDTTHFAAGSAVGTIKLTFLDSGLAMLDYTIGSATGHKQIEPEPFGANGIVGTDQTDLWWGGTSQNGWGITIMQQGSTLFPIWFTYGANGSPMWYVMPGGTWTSSTTYSGNLYRTTGSPWISAPYDSTKLQVFEAGTFGITFTGNGATFTYTADGHSGSIPLVREPF